MTESKRLRERLTFANVMATVAVFFALGGASYAATQLPKNSVGAKQLQKNAVTGAKIKKQTITAGKIKKGTLTGTQINLTKLGTVPTAQTANTLGPSENWHDAVLENGWSNGPPETPFAPAGYYKDLGGVVHLRGLVSGGTLGKAIFHLPPGYRPPSGKALTPLALCAVCGAGNNSAPVVIAGSNVSGAGQDGAVLPILGSTLGLEGISFKAES
jgi:hypothetical protein